MKIFRPYVIFLIFMANRIFADELVASSVDVKSVSKKNSTYILEEMSRQASKTINQLINEYSLPLYDMYFEKVGQQAKTYPLHKKYIDVFKKATLLVEDVRISYSPYLNQAMNKVAMTDCNTLYFPTDSFVDAVKEGNKITEKQMKLLLHEIGHSQQCQKTSRKIYAQRWFSELSPATIAALKAGKIDVKMIHDAMPLEKEAEIFSKNMYLEVIKH
ncbi:MAG: hypothetical protein ACRBCS_04300 [Cellvibrionaceae bacterium]